MYDKLYTTLHLTLITTKNMKTSLWGLWRANNSRWIGKRNQNGQYDQYNSDSSDIFFFFLIFQLGLQRIPIPELHISHKEEKPQEKFTLCFSFQRTGKEERVRWRLGGKVPSYVCFLFVCFPYLAQSQTSHSHKAVHWWICSYSFTSNSEKLLLFEQSNWKTWSLGFRECLWFPSSLFSLLCSQDELSHGSIKWHREPKTLTFKSEDPKEEPQGTGGWRSHWEEGGREKEPPNLWMKSQALHGVVYA